MVQSFKKSLGKTLQEVVPRTTPPGRDMPQFIRDGREDAEAGIQILIYGHDGCHITAAIAVIGR